MPGHFFNVLSVALHCYYSLSSISNVVGEFLHFLIIFLDFFFPYLQEQKAPEISSAFTILNFIYISTIPKLYFKANNSQSVLVLSLRTFGNIWRCVHHSKGHWHLWAEVGNTAKTSCNYQDIILAPNANSISVEGPHPAFSSHLCFTSPLDAHWLLSNRRLFFFSIHQCFLLDVSHFSCWLKSWE